MTDGAFTRCERLREAVLGCVHEGETMLAHSLGLRDQSTLDIGRIQAGHPAETRWGAKSTSTHDATDVSAISYFYSSGARCQRVRAENIYPRGNRFCGTRIELRVGLGIMQVQCISSSGKRRGISLRGGVSLRGVVIARWHIEHVPDAFAALVNSERGAH